MNVFMTTNFRWVTYARHALLFDRIVSGDLVDSVLLHDSVKAWFEANGIAFLDFRLSDRVAYSADLSQDEVERFEAFFGQRESAVL